MKTLNRTLVLAVTTLAATTLLHADNWPHWRGGLDGSGIASAADLPLEWSREKNVLWRTELPEAGNSSPVVWGNKVFVPQVGDGNDFRSLMCLDRTNGKLLWQKGVNYNKPERSHRQNPYCSSSPTTDGERVIVSYASAGIYCYDMDGKELWNRDLGPQDHVWGSGSSPLIYKDLCILYHGPNEKGEATLLAMNKATGKTVWEFTEPKWDATGRTDGFQGKDNEGIIGSFSTPILINAAGKEQLIMSFPLEVKSFDPATGKEIWHCRGLNPLVYTSTIYDNGILVAMGGYHGNSLAVRVDGQGDVSDTHRLWHKVRHNGGIGSGVIKDGLVFYQNSGIGYCLDLKTGREIWEERLRGEGRNAQSWSSFLLAGDRVYSINQSGDTIVFKADASYQQLAVNPLGEMTNSSFAVSNGEIFIRTHKSLWCIGRTRAAASLR